MITRKTLDVSYDLFLMANDIEVLSLSSLDKKEYFNLINQMEEWNLHMWNLVDHCNSKVLARSYYVKKYRCPWIIGTPIYIYIYISTIFEYVNKWDAVYVLSLSVCKVVCITF